MTLPGTTAGHLIALWVTWQPSSLTLKLPYTDPLNNTYISAVGPTIQSASNTAAQIVYAKNLQNSGNDNIAIQFANSGSATSVSCVAVEYMGADGSNPLDSVSAAASYGVGTLLDSGIAAPANANLLLFAAGISDNGTLGPGSGFSNIQSHSVGTGSAVTEQNTNPISGNNVLQRATAQLPTTPPPTTGNWIMQMAVFRDGSWNVGRGWSPVRTGTVTYCDRFPDLPTCVADADQAGGGIAVVNTRLTLSAPLTVGDSSGTPVKLQITSGGQIVANVNNSGGAAISLGPNSSIECDRNVSSTSYTNRVPSIVSGSNLNVSYLITNLIHDGSQKFAGVEGCYIADPGLDTGAITTAVIDFEGLDQIAFLNYLYIDGFANAALIRLVNLVAGGGGSDAFVLLENEVDCGDLPGCIPLLITYQGSQKGAAGGQTIVGGNYSHCKASTSNPPVPSCNTTSSCAEICLYGDGQFSEDSVGGVTIVNSSAEASETYSNGIQAHAAPGLTVLGFFVSAEDSIRGNNVVQIDSTSAPSTGVRMFGLRNPFTPTVFQETVVDNQNGGFSSDSSTLDYFTPDTTSYFGALTPGRTTYSALSTSTPTKGTVEYCSDCTIASTCGSGGHGAIAKRLNNIWVCN